MLGKLRDFLGDRVEQLALGIGRSRKEAILLGRRVEHKVIDHLARGDVDHLDAIVVDGGDVDLLVIRRQADRHGSAGGERDAIDDLRLLFVENENGSRDRRAGTKSRACAKPAKAAQLAARSVSRDRAIM